MKAFSLLAVLLLGALLVYATKDFPTWGSSQTPANQSRVSEYYITQTYDDTLVPNMVTAVLADYRGYDTMFETTVVFIAGLAIFSILGVGTMKEAREGRVAPPLNLRTVAPHDLIIRITCRLLVPPIQIFAFYVLAHGHHSPGGGFQGGVIMAASLIMLELSSDLKDRAARFTNRIAILMGIVGIFFYAGWGALCLFFGGHLLDYGVLAAIIPDDPAMARSHSMLVVETGVAFTVSSIMVLIFRQLSTGGYVLSPSREPAR